MWFNFNYMDYIMRNILINGAVLLTGKIDVIKSVFIASKMIIIVIMFDALLDLLTFAQFKKTWKTPMEDSLTLSSLTLCVLDQY